MEELEIEVTEDDIRKGRRGSSTCCPVALACSRLMDSETNVGFRLVWFTKCGLPTYNISNQLKLQINNFDSGKGFIAGHYTLEKSDAS